MDTNTFWRTIETAKASSKGEQRRMTTSLGAALRALGPEETAAFRRELDARLAAAYTWPLWGAAYLMNGGCGDDGFEYFRALLIANGRDVFEKAVKDPDSLAAANLAFGEDEAWDFESFLYVPDEVYESLTGKSIPREPYRQADPAGEKWEEEGDDLLTMFPKLARKYAG